MSKKDKPQTKFFMADTGREILPDFFNGRRHLCRCLDCRQKADIPCVGKEIRVECPCGKKYKTRSPKL